MNSVLYHVSGRVQGVGFRAWVAHQAKQLQLTGWARNTEAGSVEVAARGETSSLERFEEKLRAGPPLARVDEVRRSPEAPHVLADGFEIRR